MGACVQCRDNCITVRGKTLLGATVCAPDLRGGAALLVAALGARGQSLIEGAEVIKRGYQSIAEKLRALGGEVWEV